MSQQTELYLPWTEKKKEIGSTGDCGKESESLGQLEQLRGQAWDRTEDQAFIFVMTLALM